MKNLILLYFLSFVLVNGYSQKADPVKWESLKLKSKSDYKNAEPDVKNCVAYLLSHPYNNNDMSVHAAERLLIRWMEGTKEHSFTIQANIGKYYTNENGLLVIYMATLTKIGFESPSALADSKKSEVEALRICAKYCEDENNKVTKTAAIKKLIDAEKKDKLEELIGAK